MSKNIIIIGGGISGLALLHYLKISYYFRDDVQILLLEKNDTLGGTIKSIARKGCLFESGPNGFLDSKPRTLQLIKDIGLEDQMIKANEESKIRYISVNNALYPVPMTPQGFLSFKLLNPMEKMRVIGEMFVPKGNHPDESIYSFGKRRLGEKFTQLFIDPMVKGIFGGDARTVNLKAAFPRMYALEDEFGSLFKAMAKLKRRKQTDKNGAMGMPKGTLTSFRAGMSQFIHTLGARYADEILLNQEIKTISHYQNQYLIYSGSKQLTADELFVSTPAYSAAELLKGISPSLAVDLEKITYAPIVVVGLVFPLNAFNVRPKGFGYLIPSSQRKEVMGVLFDSNIFTERCHNDQVLLRVMMGGTQHPSILQKSREELVSIALEEVQSVFPNQQKPLDTFFVSWPKAIPQYDLDYVKVKESLERQLTGWNNFHLTANYWAGISLNDCIENAYQAAQKSAL